MNLKTVLASVVLSSLAISCAQDQPPAPASEGSIAAPAAAKESSAASSAAPGVLPGVKIDAPPKDARFTIYCLGVSGPDHTAQANQIKLLWQQATQRRDWYVVHQDDQSLVYFGYYRSISDPADRDTARAMADRKMIQSLKDSIGDQPFEQAMLLPLDAPDPTAPPQWNLVNAKGAWTLEIAVYKGRDRKTAAVDSVRQARAQGVEAYYFHGPAASSVCIGTWPEEAVTQAMHGNMQNSDPSQTLTVVPDALAAQLPDAVTDPEGNKSKVVHNGAQIADPTLTAAMEQYPTHSLNGYVDTIMVNGKALPRQSAVVAIPHSSEASSVPPTPSGRPAVDLLGGSNGGDDPAVGGRLRSMGQ